MKKQQVKQNPVIYITAYLILICIFSLAAFFIFFSNWNSLGTLPPRFDLKEAYSSESWFFGLGEDEFHLPEGGIVIPVYLEENFAGIIIETAGGKIRSSINELEHNFTAGFLAMDNKTFQNIKGNTLFIPLEDTITKKRLLAHARGYIKLPKVKTIGFIRVFLPGPESSYIYLLDNGSELIYSNTQGLKNNCSYKLLAYFGSIFLITVFTIQILSMDLYPGRNMKDLLDTRPRLTETLLCSGFLLTILLLNFFSGTASFNSTIQPFNFFFYWTVSILLLTLSRKDLITPQSFGLQPLNSGRSITIAIVVSFIITSFSSMQFPWEMVQNITYRQITTFTFYFIYALGKEIFWRGFVQTFFERLGGKWPGLVITTAVFASISFIAAWKQNCDPALNPFNSLEMLFFLPATFFMPGFLYSRSRNILGCALLHALLLFLPFMISGRPAP